MVTHSLESKLLIFTFFYLMKGDRMNKLESASKAVGKFVSENKPSILIGLGISGFVASVVWTVRATRAASDALDQAIYELYLEDNDGAKGTTFNEFMAESYLSGYTFEDRLSLLDRSLVVRTVAPYFAPVIVGIGVSSAAIIYGNREHLRRTAILVGLVEFAETALGVYKQKVFENLTVGKAAKIQADAYQAFVDADPPNAHNIYNVGGGKDLCYEMSTGRYFWSGAEKIRAVVNKFNHELLTENTKTLNELYYELGLPHTDLGDKVGWDSEDGVVELVLSAQVSELPEHPVLVVDFIYRPKYLL